LDNPVIDNLVSLEEFGTMVKLLPFFCTCTVTLLPRTAFAEMHHVDMREADKNGDIV